MRRREPVEGCVRPQAGDVVDAAPLQARQERARGEACIDAHGRDLAQAGLGPIDDVENDVQRTVGSADIAGA